MLKTQFIKINTKKTFRLRNLNKKIQIYHKKITFRLRNLNKLMLINVKKKENFF